MGPLCDTLLLNKKNPILEYKMNCVTKCVIFFKHFNYLTFIETIDLK